MPVIDVLDREPAQVATSANVDELHLLIGEKIRDPADHEAGDHIPGASARPGPCEASQDRRHFRQEPHRAIAHAISGNVAKVAERTTSGRAGSTLCSARPGPASAAGSTGRPPAAAAERPG